MQARPFVTIDVQVPPGESDPTAAVLRAISRRDIADAVVRVRVRAPAAVSTPLREGEIREALQPAHYIAAVSLELDGPRRTRLDRDSADDLQPMQALRLYLESREAEPQRRDKIIRYAEELIQADESVESTPNML